ncbi:1-(5-phosphoribosyl)-5-[(5-phosphoribosylamino)methylideneamino]imidazole-4-carboxamide isomerase [Kyrpidia spormannii]|uniref:1-(5-phosphoribosyl)-5-[(5-phosphoribosylamino)methylideneamino] imidazole-4-carboxamide isomerase n=2 Tax=Kyrpidia spormannii TaxID=2055160 RepID=A0A6F9E2Y2_9BACL|nr:1-(5-phosphoribosyl)-5-[(5-phosphoribosylamino)methylideneamino]imidazole-4-carboxamide isomerase [Kyrpidia spormannii]CAB3389867.1 phosphoribosylformimino-5-aminoimidazole carboxamide ribotide isomerase [Kyrpidia spormannii]CAB3390766.1 phosphoribosylformimino-5-aminoimidazole carboxamide ribotide isomerase [Kyrpidia spormannii]
MTDSAEFQLYPAIDLSDGRAVRLRYGDYGQMTVYGDDPVAVARRWRDEGAGWLHVVDLDGAKEGHPMHLPLIGRMVEAAGLSVQVGGGIRDGESLRALFSLGVARCVLGTAALENPVWMKEVLAEYGERIVVGLDARDGKVAVRGWLQNTGVAAVELGRRLKEWGARRALFTDIRRDGAMAGPNGRAAAELAEETGLLVIASGGVRHLGDIQRLYALRHRGVAGAVAGRALYTGDLSLKEATAWLRSGPTDHGMEDEWDEPSPAEDGSEGVRYGGEGGRVC